MKKSRQIIILFVFTCLFFLQKVSFAQIPPNAPAFGLNISVSQDRVCDSTMLINFYAGLNDTISTAGDTVVFTFYFGDGDSAVYTAIQDSTINLNINNNTIAHQYNTSGIFNVTAKAIRLVDGHITYQNTTWNLYVGLDCGRAFGVVYLDCNTNCLPAINEPKIENAKVIHFDENGARVDSVYTDNTGFYSFNIRVGEIYSLSIETPFNMNAIFTCPVSGNNTDTIVNSNHILDFGFLSPTSSDLIPQIGATMARPGMPMYVSLRTMNKSCMMANNVTTNFQINSSTVTIDTVYTTQPTNLSINTAEWTGLTVPISNTIWVKLMVDSTAQLGDTVCFSYTVGPDTINPQNNQVQYCAIVVNSSDPNAKEVFPLGTGAQGYVAPETNFTYTIHFQNVGTAAASTVKIVDTLDIDLDINTLNIISSSHPCHMVIADNLLIFNFNNISLPDSGTDFMKSNGSITFQIKAKANLVAGTEITSVASIKFDYNDYITTNSTLNTISIPTALNNQSIINNIKVFPNPSNGIIKVLSDNNLEKIIITDYMGRIVLEKFTQHKSVALDLGYLNSGLYLITTICNDNFVQQTKWIKN
jgi:uncharacterized repeat protein (TIGR01451 family)